MVKILGALLVLILTATDSEADNYWSSTGAGCVRGDPAITNNLHYVVAGSVGFQTGAGGVITLYCPVQQNSGGTLPDLLTMTYRDQNGTTTNADVKAQLIRLAKSDGTLSTISTVIDSDSSSTTSATQMQTTFFHTFNFDANYYYVRVDLSRPVAATTIMVVYGVSLDKYIP